MSDVECPLFKTAREMPDAIAIADHQHAMTFSELHQRVERIVQGLEHGKIVAGDRITWQLSNDWKCVALFWACFRAGVVACPMSFRWPEPVVKSVAESIGSRHVVTEPILDGWLEGPNRVSPRLRCIDDEAWATILFSTGTTGQPKAVVHNLRSHVLNARGSNLNLPVRPGDRWWLSLPLFHVGGLAIVFRCCLAGATLVIDRPRASHNDTIRSLRVTHVSMVPAQLKRWLDSSSGFPAVLPTVLLGGDVLPPELIARAFSAGIPLRTTYGLSEMASQVTATSGETPLANRTTAGQTLPYRELSISESGEILVRGETLFQGYFRQAGLTPTVDAQGWYPTGDLGELDDAGYLTVTGRADNMFISGGENIYPEEIESVLLDLPGIRQAVVVPIQDERFGSRPVAFVDVEEIQLTSILDYLSDRLPKFKIPDAFLPWPRDASPAGLKPGRQELKRLASSQMGNQRQSS